MPEFPRRQFLQFAATAAALPFATRSACAALDYPQRPVRVLVGFTGGTAPDVAARLIAGKFADAWGSPCIVEDVTGAGSNIATDQVAKAKPDGHTLLMGGNSALVINPSLYDRLPFDPVKDFAPISQIFVASNILVVHPDVPVKSLPELVALARANPGKLTYGHTGVGTSQHLAAELFKYMAHLDIQPVAYRGTTAMMPDLLAGRINLAFGNIVNVLPAVRDNRLRPFAVTSVKRAALAPELPTMAESGYPGFEAVPWFGLLAPAGTPQPIVDKIHAETMAVLATADVRKAFYDVGLDIIGSSPAEFAAVIKKEMPEWATVIKAAGIRIAN